MDAKLRERLLLARAVEDDRLMLADATLLAALDGSQALTPDERTVLQQSPLTIRRFRQLALARHAENAGLTADVTPSVRRSGTPAANEPLWSGSAGLLRAASSSAALEQLRTDDDCWTLDFLEQEDGWQLILKLAVAAPFAARLLREHTLLRVVDGGGAIVLQGRLDADGECECRWPFATAPAPHFQLYGASFAVEPVPT
ncbi:hypothetical protein HSX11_06015 [Oxalobacteraceae bacterium]|nr:hypothetical protein [Oxalobacteraceae bacterium]